MTLVITLANAVKPVAIDDTAYLTYARQIAAHPLDPYGFEMFWYTVPDNAFEILAPPVVPYWLALGMRLVGENPPLLKLWLFPFVFLLVWALRDLLRRFAPNGDPRLLALIVLSPAVLPTVNLMLDIPALALGLAAVVLFCRADDRGSWPLALLAGLSAGLAMQTKYTALLIPVAIGWYALTRWRFRPLLLAGASNASAVTVFAAWEIFLVATYGRSHFAYHVADRQPAGTLSQALLDKLGFVTSLEGDVGCLGIGIGLVAAMALGVPRRWVALAAAAWCAGFAWVALTPAQWCAYTSPAGYVISAANTFWITSGSIVLLVLLAGTVMAVVRFRPRPGLRLDADAWFLSGWLLIELAGFFALTPFGAARRVIGLVVIGGIFTAWLVAHFGRERQYRRPRGWLLAFGVAAGVLVSAIDTYDAFPEKVLAEQAAEVAARIPNHKTVWFAGHWGFQFYCTRSGMRQLEPGRTVLEPGDVLVLPLFPDEDHLYRPHLGSVTIRPPADVVEEVEVLVWDDWLSAQTIPTFYCGTEPVLGRDYPRLRVAVYRLKASWKVPGKKE